LVLRWSGRGKAMPRFRPASRPRIGWGGLAESIGAGFCNLSGKARTSVGGVELGVVG
jgi:hypothetical protein